jgi:hypothetical protein
LRRWLVAHRADQQIDPFLGAELGAQLAVFIQVEAGQLDGRELADRERRLAVALIPLHLHLGPDPTGEQPLKGMHIVIGDAQAVAAEVDAFGHIGVADQADLDLVDEGVAPLLLDLALGLGGLIRTDVVVGQGVAHHREAQLDGGRIGGGAVLAEQVLEHENRHVGAHLHGPHQVLTDAFAREDLIDLVVEGVAAGAGGCGGHRAGVAGWPVRGTRLISTSQPSTSA